VSDRNGSRTFFIITKHTPLHELWSKATWKHSYPYQSSYLLPSRNPPKRQVKYWYRTKKNQGEALYGLIGLDWLLGTFCCEPISRTTLYSILYSSSLSSSRDDRKGTTPFKSCTLESILQSTTSRFRFCLFFNLSLLLILSSTLLLRFPISSTQYILRM
jgi:hypothetical protein